LDVDGGGAPFLVGRSLRVATAIAQSEEPDGNSDEDKGGEGACELAVHDAPMRGTGAPPHGNSGRGAAKGATAPRQCRNVALARALRALEERGTRQRGCARSTSMAARSGRESAAICRRSPSNIARST